MPESGRGGGEKERKRAHAHTLSHTQMHLHAHSHTNKSHTFRRGRRSTDMKSCHLKGKKGGRERRGKEGWKKICSTLLSIMCILRQRAGRMPWSVEEAESVPTILLPCLFLILSTHTQPQSFILLLKCAFIIQWNFIQQLRRESLLNVREANCERGILKKGGSCASAADDSCTFNSTSQSMQI